MKRKLGVASALLAGSMIFMNAALADDTLFGALLGGGAGVLVGQAVGGRDGAVVGGALGAIAGAVIASDDDERRGDYRRHGRGYNGGYSRGYAVQPRVVEYAPQAVVVPRTVHYAARQRDDGGYYRDRDGYRERHGHHGDRDGYRERRWDRDRDRHERYRD